MPVYRTQSILEIILQILHKETLNTLAHLIGKPENQQIVFCRPGQIY